MNGKDLNANDLEKSTQSNTRSNNTNPIRGFLSKSKLIRRVLNFDKVRPVLDNFGSNARTKEVNHVKDTVDYSGNIEQKSQVNHINQNNLPVIKYTKNLLNGKTLTDSLHQKATPVSLKKLLFSDIKYLVI